MHPMAPFWSTESIPEDGLTTAVMVVPIIILFEIVIILIQFCSVYI
jgi:hypothetical protein